MVIKVHDRNKQRALVGVDVEGTGQLVRTNGSGYLVIAGLMTREGTVDSVTSSTVFVCSELKGYLDSYFKNGWYVVPSWDSDGAGAAPQGEIRKCTAYTSSTGTFTIETPFSANLEADDLVFLVYKLIAEKAITDTGSAGGLITGKVTDEVNAPTTSTFDVAELAGMEEDILTNWWATIIWDAGGTGSAPQGEFRRITAFSSNDGNITVDEPFSAAPGAGDIVKISEELEIERSVRSMYQEGIVDSVTATTTTVRQLSGFREEFFKNWTLYVNQDVAGGGVAPQGQHTIVTAYDSDQGKFTHAAMATAITAGDTISLIHPTIATGLSIGLTVMARITSYTDTSNFASTDLAAYNSGLFYGWDCYVLWDSAGGGALPQGESRRVSTFTTGTGAIVLGQALANAAQVGDWILLVHQAISRGEVDYRDQETIGAADYTSEATLVTWNSNNDRCTYHNLVIDIGGFTNGAILTIKFYQYINGAANEEIIHQWTRVPGTDNNGFKIIDGGFETSERIRITIESDNAGDNSVSVPLSATATNRTGIASPFT